MALRPALFIDRDGTLTEEVGYVNRVATDLLEVVDWALARRAAA